MCIRVELLLRIAYLKKVSAHLVSRATPDAAGKARPTVNHITVMNYVKLGSIAPQNCLNMFRTRAGKRSALRRMLSHSADNACGSFYLCGNHTRCVLMTRNAPSRLSIR